MSSPYIGIWINWSRGAITGSTLTLNLLDGYLLISFFTLLVSAAGAAIWRILRYALHQYRSKQRFQDVLHHQQQIILRNSGSPVGDLWQMLQLTWYWRGNASRRLLRTLPFAGLALLNLILFSIFGVFSSIIIRASGNEVLIRSPNCGHLFAKEASLTSANAVADIAALMINDTLAATAYQEYCYDNSGNLPQCSQFVQKKIPWTVDQNAPCPFASDMCLLGSKNAYQMDTGLIDSHFGLGINAPRTERVQYRKVTSCSPIQTNGFAKPTNDANKDFSTMVDTVIQYRYGEANSANYTYSYYIHGPSDPGNNSVGYQLATIYTESATEDSDFWSPMADLNRTDATVSLFFLAQNSVVYTAPVEDPFFRATIPAVHEDDENNFTSYSSDSYVNVLGCIDQHQFCNPAMAKCTNLTAAYTIFDEIPSISLNDAQNETTYRVGVLLNMLNTNSVVNSRGASALRASESTSDAINFRTGLPDNQWITEISTWFARTLALLQQKTVQYVTGPPYTSDALELIRPDTKAGKKLCNNQMVKSQGGTASFSVLWVAIIPVCGVVLIITSFTIDSLVSNMRHRFHWDEYKSLQWTIDEKLQLQRLAYEEAGQGHWSGGANSVPVTQKGEKIGLPQPVDTLHPRLSQTGSQSEQVVGGDDDTAEAEGLMTCKEMAQHHQTD